MYTNPFEMMLELLTNQVTHSPIRCSVVKTSRTAVQREHPLRFLIQLVSDTNT